MQKTFFLLILFFHNLPCILQGEPFLYVSDAAAGKDVSVVDAATNAIVATINVSSPSTSVVSPDGQFVYVQAPADIAVIDTSTNIVIATINNAFTGGNQLAVSNDGKRLYSVNFAAGDLSINVIDTTTNTIIDNLSLGSSFPAVATSSIGIYPNDDFLFISVTDFSTFFGIINLNTLTLESTIPSSSLLTNVGIAISNDANFAYVIGNNTALEIVNLNAQTTFSLPVVSVGSAIGTTPNGRYVVFHQATGGDFFYSLLDPSTNTIVGTITNSLDNANSIAFSSDSVNAYVAYPLDGTIEVIDLKNQSIIKAISGFSFPVAVSVKPQFALNLSGFSRKSRFLTQTALINTLSWEFIDFLGITIKEYRIFRDNVFLTTIASPDPAVFRDAKVKKGRTYLYRVEAVLESGGILTSEEIFIKTTKK